MEEDVTGADSYLYLYLVHIDNIHKIEGYLRTYIYLSRRVGAAVALCLCVS
jgi:hypothetical protein